MKVHSKMDFSMDMGTLQAKTGKSTKVNGSKDRGLSG